MNPTDQWYYLDGSETRGPVPSAQIAQLIKAGSLSPATQVAQAGWPKWSAASVSLSHLLGGSQPGLGPAAAQAEPPTYAIKVQCVSGPDAGRAYMIAAAEVSLGRVSGIGQNDPQVAENHVDTSTPQRCRAIVVGAYHGPHRNAQLRKRVDGVAARCTRRSGDQECLRFHCLFHIQVGQPAAGSVSKKPSARRGPSGMSSNSIMPAIRNGRRSSNERASAGSVVLI